MEHLSRSTCNRLFQAIKISWIKAVILRIKVYLKEILSRKILAKEPEKSEDLSLLIMVKYMKVNG